MAPSVTSPRTFVGILGRLPPPRTSAVAAAAAVSVGAVACWLCCREQGVLSRGTEKKCSGVDQAGLLVPLGTDDELAVEIKLRSDRYRATKRELQALQARVLASDRQKTKGTSRGREASLGKVGVRRAA